MPRRVVGIQYFIRVKRFTHASISVTSVFIMISVSPPTYFYSTLDGMLTSLQWATWSTTSLYIFGERREC
jgi:hypothetical protein